MPPRDDSPLKIVGYFLKVKRKIPKPIPVNFHLEGADLSLYQIRNRDLRSKTGKIFTPKVTPKKTMNL